MNGVLSPHEVLDVGVGWCHLLRKGDPFNNLSLVTKYYLMPLRLLLITRSLLVVERRPLVPICQRSDQDYYQDFYQDSLLLAVVTKRGRSRQRHFYFGHGNCKNG